MFIHPSALFGVAFLAVGVYWCYVVIKRLPEDIQDLREADDNYRKMAIVVVWILTVLVAIVVLFFSIPIIVVLVKSTYDIFTTS